MAEVWCNGIFLDESRATIPISDRGFTLADGIFETILAIGDDPLWLDDHLQRLRAAAGQLGLHVAYDDAAIGAAIAGLLTRAGLDRAAIRVTLTRGPTSQRGLWVSDNPGHPTLLITCAPVGKTAPQRVIICRTTRRNEQSPLSRIKSLNYGDNILARRDAIASGATDALMLNGNGHIACATVGNVFFNLDGAWVTPPVSDGILPGLARKRLIERLGVREESLSSADLQDAAMAFISNSLGCSPIVAIEARTLPRVPDESVFSIYG